LNNSIDKNKLQTLLS